MKQMNKLPADFFYAELPIKPEGDFFFYLEQAGQSIAAQYLLSLAAEHYETCCRCSKRKEKGCKYMLEKIVKAAAETFK